MALKTKIVFDVTPEFRSHWLRLCEREHLTQAEMFRRLVAKEGFEMTEYQGLHIEMTVHTDDVLSDAADADIDATASNYRDRLESELQSEYPGASVKIRLESGAGFSHLRIWHDSGEYVGGAVEQEIENVIDRIGLRLLDNSEEWIVEQ